MPNQSRRREEIEQINIGCGHLYRDGWINLDYQKGKIEVLANLENGLPFKDGTIDYVYASHVLEHINNVTDLIKEVHRVLKTGGRFEIYVPYGVTTSLYHAKYFFLRSMNAFVPFDIPLDNGFESRDLFVKIVEEVSKYATPFGWHLEHYLGISIYRLPIWKPKEIHWILEKI